jgi:hypothetical protein
MKYNRDGSERYETVDYFKAGAWTVTAIGLVLWMLWMHYDSAKNERIRQLEAQLTTVKPNPLTEKITITVPYGAECVEFARVNQKIMIECSVPKKGE